MAIPSVGSCANEFPSSRGVPLPTVSPEGPYRGDNSWPVSVTVGGSSYPRGGAPIYYDDECHPIPAPSSQYQTWNCTSCVPKTVQVGDKKVTFYVYSYRTPFWGSSWECRLQPLRGCPDEMEKLSEHRYSGANQEKAFANALDAFKRDARQYEHFYSRSFGHVKVDEPATPPHIPDPPPDEDPPPSPQPDTWRRAFAQKVEQFKQRAADYFEPMTTGYNEVKGRVAEETGGRLIGLGQHTQKKGDAWIELANHRRDEAKELRRKANKMANKAAQGKPVRIDSSGRKTSDPVAIAKAVNDLKQQQKAQKQRSQELRKRGEWDRRKGRFTEDTGKGVKKVIGRTGTAAMDCAGAATGRAFVDALTHPEEWQKDPTGHSWGVVKEAGSGTAQYVVLGCADKGVKSFVRHICNKPTLPKYLPVVSVVYQRGCDTLRVFRAPGLKGKAWVVAEIAFDSGMMSLGQVLLPWPFVGAAAGTAAGEGIKYAGRWVLGYP